MTEKSIFPPGPNKITITQLRQLVSYGSTITVPTISVTVKGVFLPFIAFKMHDDQSCHCPNVYGRADGRRLIQWDES